MLSSRSTDFMWNSRLASLTSCPRWIIGLIWLLNAWLLYMINNEAVWILHSFNFIEMTANCRYTLPSSCCILRISSQDPKLYHKVSRHIIKNSLLSIQRLSITFHVMLPATNAYMDKQMWKCNWLAQSGQHSQPWTLCLPQTIIFRLCDFRPQAMSLEPSARQSAEAAGAFQRRAAG